MLTYSSFECFLLQIVGLFLFFFYSTFNVLKLCHGIWLLLFLDELLPRRFLSLFLFLFDLLTVILMEGTDFGQFIRIITFFLAS